MSTTFKAMLPKVQPSCAGCGSPMAVEAIRQAVTEFCQRTKAWQASATITFIADQPEYALTLPANTVLVDVVKCLYNEDSLPISPNTETELDKRHAGWRQAKAQRPAFYYLPNLSTIRFVDMPSEAKINAVTLRVSVKPTNGATAFDTELYDQYADALAAGAKASLMLMPNKEWTNPELALVNAGIFDSMVSKVQRRVFKSNTRTNMYASAPEFGY